MLVVFEKSETTKNIFLIVWENYAHLYQGDKRRERKWQIEIKEIFLNVAVRDWFMITKVF